MKVLTAVSTGAGYRPALFTCDIAVPAHASQILRSPRQGLQDDCRDDVPLTGVWNLSLHERYLRCSLSFQAIIWFVFGHQGWISHEAATRSINTVGRRIIVPVLSRDGPCVLSCQQDERKPTGGRSPSGSSVQ